MSTDVHQLVVEIKIAWWFPYYWKSVLVMTLITGMELNHERFDYWCRRALTMTIKAKK
jgi:hypothetical protein